ncbi:MAG TPA: hypothetical protein VH136_16715 [Trebonia sp.]|jgi:hypothetical protein|nr:hypothetical protein [Trebonia sp.]
MDTAELRKARDTTLAAHVDAENRNDVDAVIATFKHPRYELVPVGEIFDGDLPSIAVFEFDGADLMCERVYYDAGAFAALAGD